MGDDAGERALVMRVMMIEAPGDELRVLLVDREDDGLAQPVAAVHLQPVLHRVLQHQVDGVLVEQPLVDLGRVDLVRSEEHTSELQSLMRISYAVFCLKKKKNT